MDLTSDYGWTASAFEKFAVFLFLLIRVPCFKFKETIQCTIEVNKFEEEILLE